MRSYSGASRDISAELRRAGWSIARDAMEPLRRIDFARLVDIHDHEQHFLERTFVSSLVGIREARVATPAEEGKIVKKDVETALRMLGTAVARQSEETISANSKRIIIDSCGFC